MKRIAAALAALSLVASAGQAAAWGGTGHRIIGVTAMQALPPEMPAFLRSADAAIEVGELSREPDRWKGAGEMHDKDRELFHFVDIDPAGKILGGPHIDALPATRIEYQKALIAAGTDEAKAGALPYGLIDGWQQVAQNFAYWRVLVIAEARATTPERRAWLTEDRRRREKLILRDLGVWGHYVGDASQPHHTSVHFNGWGPYPNPEGFTQEKVHSAFESAFVRSHITAPMLAGKLPPPSVCTAAIERCLVDYIKQSNAQTIPFYRLEKAGGFKPGDPRGQAFAVERLAAGAAAMRDFTVSAWRASATSKVGWRPVSVADVEAGRADPFDSLYGID